MGMGPPPPPPPMHLRGPFPPRYSPSSYVDRTEGSLFQDFFLRSLASSELDVSRSAVMTLVSLQRFSSE